MLPSFVCSTRIFQGRPAADVLSSEIQRAGLRRAVFVTDPGVLKANLLGGLEKALPAGCVSVGTFSDVMQDPTAALMNTLGRRCIEEKVDVLVAVGGGACLDAAKAAALVATHGGSALDIVGEDKVRVAPLPVVCIPTTAGTGSEVSWHISVNDPERQLKVTVRSPLAVAMTAILDPAMVATVPRPVIASSGMDAFTHLLEAYVGNVGNWDLTEALCLHAIGMIGRSLVPYSNAPADRHHALQMQIAACIGGLALSHSRTGIVHQMARPLGARFHVPHGLANAVLLPWCVAFTHTSNAKRFARLASALGAWQAGDDEQRAAARVAEVIHRLNADLDVPRSLAPFGVRADALDDMAQDALQGKPAVTNPCHADKSDVVAIYRRALEGAAHV